MQLEQLSKVRLDRIKPGEKHDLTVKLKDASQLENEVKQTIKLLIKQKKYASRLADAQQAQAIEGLIKSLEILQSNLDKQIEQLNQQLDVVPADLKILFDKIQKDCKNYIDAVKHSGHWLYRGASGRDAHVGRSWQTRTPRDSDPVASENFDRMLARLGFVALRGNSIFTTSDAELASSFGTKLFVIFPVDARSDFTYTREDDITLNPWDLNYQEYENDWQSSGSLTNKDALLKIELQDLAMNLINNVLKADTPVWVWQLSDLLDQDWISIRDPDVIKILQEIPEKETALIPEKFFKLKPKSSKKSSSKPKITQNQLNIFVQNYDPQKTNLEQALLSGVEVYISGVYYALNTAVYGRYIKSYFGVPLER